MLINKDNYITRKPLSVKVHKCMMTSGAPKLPSQPKTPNPLNPANPGSTPNALTPASIPPIQDLVKSPQSTPVATHIPNSPAADHSTTTLSTPSYSSTPAIIKPSVPIEEKYSEALQYKSPTATETPLNKPLQHDPNTFDRIKQRAMSSDSSNPPEVQQNWSSNFETSHSTQSSSLLGSGSPSTSSPSTDDPIPFASLDENMVITEGVKRGTVDFATAGKAGENGSPRLTTYGYELERRIFNSENKINFKTVSEDCSNESSPESLGQNESLSWNDKDTFHVVTVNISEETIITRPEQSHAVVVKGNPQTEQTVEMVGILTSQKGINTGSGSIPNIKLSETQMSGEKKDQYLSPMIPPKIVNATDCEYNEIGSQYLQNPIIQSILESVSEAVEKYEPIPYTTKGYTTEDLQEINDLDDQIQNTLVKNEEIVD